MKISAQVALALALGVVGSMGTMHAGPIHTFNLSGVLESGSSGVPSLSGGSFSGTFAIDIDLLPATPSATLTLASWNVVVRNSGGTVVQTFLSGVGTQSGILQGEQNGVQSDALNFNDSVTNNRLTLAFFQGFDGNGSVQQSITTNFITLNSEFQMGNALDLIGVTEGSSAAALVGTPEPGTVTLLGAGVLLLVGAKFRRGVSKAA